MGTVFEAEDRNGHRVAIKISHRQQAHPRLRKQFLRERDLARRVGHPDVVRVLDDGETPDGDVFLVMELLDGATLEQESGKRPLSWAEVFLIADRVLDVLQVAHAKGIVHRDIKPSNIFLRARGGGVKVLDFGVALSNEIDISVLSLPGAAGTPSFMAPEQARGALHRIDRRTDLWALGATMFTTLTGRLVHEEKSANAALIAAATTPCRLIGSVLPDLPTYVTEIVDCALSFDQEERFERADEMQFAVRRVLCRRSADEMRSPALFPWRREPKIADTLPGFETGTAFACT